MSGAEHPKSSTCRAVAFVLVCAALVFGVAVATGVLEVRRPTKPASLEPAPPTQAAKPFVQRVKSAEDLAEALWVYRFAGGIPKCWAEIESEGHKQTVGPWVSVNQLTLFGGDPIPDSVEGYVALFRPKGKEQTYRLAVAVTRAKYPENTEAQAHLTAFREPGGQVTLPDLRPAPEPKGKEPGTSFSSTRNDGEDQRVVPIGEDFELNFLRADTPATKSGLHIRFRLRFLTPDEVAAAKAKP